MPEARGCREANSALSPVPAICNRRLSRAAFSAAEERRHPDDDCKSPIRPCLAKSQLDSLALQCKVIAVQPNWAEENLQVIRTLMERAGLYRRALAPVMVMVGMLGVLGALVGEALVLESPASFVRWWFLVAFTSIAFSLLIVRRQALRSDEGFWTPPTRKVCTAMTPPLTAGFFIAALPMVDCAGSASPVVYVIAWLLLYGCALHSAGQFISQGVRLLGWAFVLAAGLLGCVASEYFGWTGMRAEWIEWLRPHRFMGFTFGGFHLIAAAYLYFTEKREPTP
jgi:uncharacterized membrane protein YfcA